MIVDGPVAAGAESSIPMSGRDVYDPPSDAPLGTSVARGGVAPGMVAVVAATLGSLDVVVTCTLDGIVLVRDMLAVRIGPIKGELGVDEAWGTGTVGGAGWRSAMTGVVSGGIAAVSGIGPSV